jgi:iron-regulated transporter 1
MHIFAPASPSLTSRSFTGINVVYHRLPILETEEKDRTAARSIRLAQTRETHAQLSLTGRLNIRTKAIGPGLRRLASDWVEFVNSPVFPSSLAISLLYMTVLS